MQGGYRIKCAIPLPIQSQMKGGSQIKRPIPLSRSIQSEGGDRIFNPPPQLRLHPGMTLVALGELDELKCLYRYVHGEEILVAKRKK